MKIKLVFLLLSLFIEQLSAQQKGVSPIKGVSGQLTVISNTYAVVIGISDYQDPAIPDLRFSDKDAEAFANYLRSSAGGKLDNDHLKVLINREATMAQFANALDWLWEVCKEGDQAIIYFSGHGDVEKKSLTQPGFLLCWDAPARVYMAGGAFALPMLQEVVSTLSIQNKAKVIIITDACRSGTLAGSSVSGAQATAANLAKQFGNEIKIMSCQPNEYSIEGEQWGGGRGAFSYHLLDALYGMADINNDLWVTLQEIGRYLEDHVTNEVAPVSQVPMTVGNRNERLASIDERLLASLKSGKSHQTMLLSQIESRGIEEDVLSKLDTSTKLTYQLFKKALKNKTFLEPIDSCANSYYEQLVNEPKLERLHSTMKRNYAAALQDDAQQVINKWLQSDLAELALSKKSKFDKYAIYPQYLEKAASILGEEHFLYRTLQARKHFFAGYLIALNKRELDENLAKKALKEFEQSLQLEPDAPHVYWQMIAVFGFNLTHPDSAEYCALKAIEYSPTWALPYARLAYILYTRYKNFTLAKHYLELSTSMDSSSLITKNLWGLYYTELKQYESAETYFKNIIQLDSTYLYAYSNLGWVYELTGKFADSEKMYKKSISLDSSNANQIRNLAELYLLTRNYSRAIAFFTKAIEIDSTVSDYFNSLGNSYLYLGQYSNAEKNYKKAILVDSTQAISYYNLGTVYIQLKKYAIAEKNMITALNKDSSMALAYNGLGYIYMNTNQYDKADLQFNQSIYLNVELNNAHYNLACLYCLQNRIQEAFTQLENAIMHGYTDFEWMQQDSDLALLRAQTDRWNAVMKKYFPDKVK